MIKSNDLHNFTFDYLSAGHYKVTYTTDKRGDYWIAIITDMTLIDSTKNADVAKIKDIAWLRKKVINNGWHYNKYGERID